MTKKPKLISSIRAKLVSAVAMLLVAVIMVVSSTYAWFTLSTAPEVTGITTQIGANGALEMALLPSSGLLTGIKSEVGDSLKAINERNTTWGNLVDLSDNLFYGMDKITLLPSALNMTELDGSDTRILMENMLKTPVYGADGRIQELSPNTVFGNYTEGAFVPGDEYGFRAVGVASGMTKRQLAYTNARSAASTAAAQAKNTAAVSLSKNGSALANIAIQHAANAAATYTQEDIASLKAIVNDLLGSDDTTGSLEYIEIAYMQYILAYAASTAAGEFEIWSTIEAAIAEENATVNTVLNKLTSVTVPAEFTNSVDKLYATINTVETAQSELNALTGDEITWAQLSTPLYRLADVDGMEVNDIPAKDIKEKMSELINSVGGGGLKVTMATGGGVYADIADHCGDYDASITIEKVEYNGLTLSGMNARMKTATTVSPQYLPAIGTLVSTAGMYVGATQEVMPLTEFYGYIIDMAFRTNAAESNLLLQTDAIDRIYGEKGTNEQTQGHGSSMTFKATSTGFTDEQVKHLMDCIRIVFFTKTANGNEILCEARLDTENATIGADGVTAKMYIYKIETSKVLSDSAKDENGNIVSKTDADTILYYYNSADQKYYDAADFTTATEVGMDTILENINVATEEDETLEKSEDGVIAPLTQNTAIAISALVYLDGESLTNADVAYEAATSVTGTANFQFASSANLVPMNYAPLQGGSTGNNAGGEEANP